MKPSFARIFSEALQRRARLKATPAVASDPRREFHGPNEGCAGHFSLEIAVDRFDQWAWVTSWSELRSEARAEIGEVLRAHFQGAVWIDRPEGDLPALPQVLFGEVPENPFAVSEGGVKLWIQLQGQRHPGLFLDHAPLRAKLRQGNWIKQKTVLNTFAYTGSLSLAAAAGGASAVLTLDLSRPTIEWAKRNWELNGERFSGCEGDFIFGDTFEWLEKFRKKKRIFDVIMLDPPSFSRAGKKRFSTAKDLVELHALALACLAENGILISSINSANISRAQYEKEVREAFAKSGKALEVLETLSVPAQFTGVEISPRDSYLKGWVIRANSL